MTMRSHCAMIIGFALLAQLVVAEEDELPQMTTKQKAIETLGLLMQGKEPNLDLPEPLQRFWSPLDRQAEWKLRRNERIERKEAKEEATQLERELHDEEEELSRMNVTDPEYKVATEHLTRLRQTASEAKNLTETLEADAKAELEKHESKEGYLGTGQTKRSYLSLPPQSAGFLQIRAKEDEEPGAQQIKMMDLEDADPTPPKKEAPLSQRRAAEKKVKQIASQTKEKAKEAAWQPAAAVSTMFENGLVPTLTQWASGAAAPQAQPKEKIDPAFGKK